MDREGVRIAHVDEIAAEAEEPGDERRWKPVRATLGIDAFGANAFVADAGQLIVHLADPATVRRVRLGGRLGRLPRTYGVTTTLSASPLLMRGNASGVSSSDTTSVTTPRMFAVFCSSMSSACTWSR